MGKVITFGWLYGWLLGREAEPFGLWPRYRLDENVMIMILVCLFNHESAVARWSQVEPGGARWK